MEELTDNLRKNQIHEKVAMLYGYADQFKYMDPKYDPSYLLKRIDADINAMNKIKSSISEGEKEVRDAGDAMFNEMIGGRRVSVGNIESMTDDFNDLFR